VPVRLYMSMAALSDGGDLGSRAAVDACQVMGRRTMLEIVTLDECIYRMDGMISGCTIPCTGEHASHAPPPVDDKDCQRVRSIMDNRSAAYGGHSNPWRQLFDESRACGAACAWIRGLTAAGQSRTTPTWCSCSCPTSRFRSPRSWIECGRANTPRARAHRRAWQVLAQRAGWLDAATRVGLLTRGLPLGCAVCPAACRRLTAPAVQRVPGRRSAAAPLVAQAALSRVAHAGAVCGGQAGMSRLRAPGVL
jgi:hypothetical protein